MVQRHLFNEIDGAAVDTMMQVAESNYGLGRDYFKLKARLLGLPSSLCTTSTLRWAKRSGPFRTRKLSRLSWKPLGPSHRHFVRLLQSSLQALDRRGSSQGQTRRRLLRLPVTPPSSLYSVLHRQPARRDDRGPRIGTRPARLSQPQAKLLITTPADHSRDRFGLRRDAGF